MSKIIAANECIRDGEFGAANVGVTNVAGKPLLHHAYLNMKQPVACQINGLQDVNPERQIEVDPLLIATNQCLSEPQKRCELFDRARQSEEGMLRRVSPIEREFPHLQQLRRGSAEIDVDAETNT